MIAVFDYPAAKVIIFHLEISGAELSRRRKFISDIVLRTLD
jgi:hypothetical protein